MVTRSERKSQTERDREWMTKRLIESLGENVIVKDEKSRDSSAFCNKHMHRKIQEPLFLQF